MTENMQQFLRQFRASAMESLKKFNAPQAESQEITATRQQLQRAKLNSKLPRERWQAAAAFRNTTIETGDLWAIGRLLNDSDPFVRMEAATTLKNVGGETAIAILQQTLAGKQAAGLATSAETLATLREKSAIPQLMTLLQHEDAGVRASAAAALGHLCASNETEAVQSLLRLLSDEISGVRQITAQALGRIGNSKAAAPLAMLLSNKKEFRLVRCAAAWSLGNLGSDSVAIEALAAALTDRDGEVRVLAAQGLGQIGHAKVLEALRVLANDQTSTERGLVANAAIQAIKQIEARHATANTTRSSIPIQHGEESLSARRQRLGLTAPTVEKSQKQKSSSNDEA